MPNQRDASRQNWTSQRNSLEEINSGSLQRIADATELMAKDRQQTETNLAFYKRSYQEQGEYIGSLHRSQAAYKAHITRLRNKLAESEVQRYKARNERELAKAISQFTGWKYRPECDVVELADQMGLKLAEYHQIREDLTFLHEEDLAALDQHFTADEEEPA